MPIPIPKDNETKKEFLDRCMADEVMQEYDDKQRYAVCELQLERNIKVVSGAPCSGKNTYVEKHKRKGDIVWDFDKIHSALTGEETHKHIEQVRKYIFSMREKFYNDLKAEKDLRVWIINSSPIKEVRENLAKELNAEIIYIKRSKDDCLQAAAEERPQEWKEYIENYFTRFEDITEEEEIQIIEVNTMENIKKRHIISIQEDEKTVTIVYEKDTDDHSEEDLEETEAESVESEKEDEVIEEEIEDSIYNARSIEGVNVWDKKHTTETRYFNVETRIDKKEGKDVVVGHAAVFDSLSEDLGGFKEKIAVGAFDNVLENDTRAYFNHNPDYLLGRVSAGTLRLAVDEKGLRYELDLPNTTAGRDLKENLRLGNITQSSFAFTIGENGDSWERGENGNDIRIINKVDRLFDVSPVSLPAYPSADDLALAKRSNLLDKEKHRQKAETRFEENEVRNSLLKLEIELKKRTKL